MTAKNLQICLKLAPQHRYNKPQLSIKRILNKIMSTAGQSLNLKD